MMDYFIFKVGNYFFKSMFVSTSVVVPICRKEKALIIDVIYICYMRYDLTALIV